MRYQIAKVGEPGNLYIEQEDITRVEPVRDGRHAARVFVRYRNEYRQESAFRGTDGHELHLLLNVRQMLEIVEQDRAEQSSRGAFCTDCYDHGKAEEPPVTKTGAMGLGPARLECARCSLLHACRTSGQGDYRRQIPPHQYGPTWVSSAVIVVLVALWWWTLCRWAAASSEAGALSIRLTAAERELGHYRPKVAISPAPVRAPALNWHRRAIRHTKPGHRPRK